MTKNKTARAIISAFNYHSVVRVTSFNLNSIKRESFSEESSSINRGSYDRFNDARLLPRTSKPLIGVALLNAQLARKEGKFL